MDTPLPAADKAGLPEGMCGARARTKQTQRYHLAASHNESESEDNDSKDKDDESEDEDDEFEYEDIPRPDLLRPGRQRQIVSMRARTKQTGEYRGTNEATGEAGEEGVS